MKNNTFLMVVMVLLITIKFIILPIIEWQDELLSETFLLETKLNKSQQYINDLPNLLKKKSNLEAVIEELNGKVETYNDIGRYQIAKQREIDLLFKEHNVTIKSLNWQDSIQTENGHIAQLNVQFSSQLKDFILLQLDVLALGKTVEIAAFGVNINAQDEKSLGVTSGNIVVLFKPLEINDAII